MIFDRKEECWKWLECLWKKLHPNKNQKSLCLKGDLTQMHTYKEYKMQLSAYVLQNSNCKKQILNQTEGKD